MKRKYYDVYEVYGTVAGKEYFLGEITSKGNTAVFMKSMETIYFNVRSVTVKRSTTSEEFYAKLY